MPKSRNISWSQSRITSANRGRLLQQQGCVLWFTGLSGSGKTTIARALEERLYELEALSYVLDGDNVRHGLNRDLGFSPQDRRENIRRVGEVAALFADAGIVTLSAFISPYVADRVAARACVEPLPFIEVYLSTPLSACEERDPKGLYQKARRGEITDMTGIDAPYEAPVAPELQLNTAVLSVAECVDDILLVLGQRSILRESIASREIITEAGLPNSL